MNKIQSSAALIAILTLTACEQPATTGSGAATAPEPPALETQSERLSYAIGDGLGQQLRKDQVPLDVEAFAEGMARAFEERDALLTAEEINAEMTAFAQESYDRAKAAWDAVGEENMQAGLNYLVRNSNKEGVVSLQSGVQYRILEAGEGPTPGATDKVEVHYRGTLLDGTEFDSSYTRGEASTFSVDGVIKGWSEVLQLMPVGSKWEVVIPPEHAYGEKGSAPKIGPWATLIFQVELLDIVEEAAQVQEQG